MKILINKFMKQHIRHRQKYFLVWENSKCSVPINRPISSSITKFEKFIFSDFYSQNLTLPFFLIILLLLPFSSRKRFASNDPELCGVNQNATKILIKIRELHKQIFYGLIMFETISFFGMAIPKPWWLTPMPHRKMLCCKYKFEI